MHDKSNEMKKVLIYTLLALAALITAMALTCPDKEQHRTTLKKEYNDYSFEKMGLDFGEGTRQMMMSVLGNGLVGVGIDMNLEVKNNLIFSIGTISYREVTETVSVGIFGKVFTADPKKIERAAELSIQNS